MCDKVAETVCLEVQPRHASVYLVGLLVGSSILDCYLIIIIIMEEIYIPQYLMRRVSTPKISNLQNVHIKHV